MSKRAVAVSIVLAVDALALAACLPGDGTHTSADPAGFLWGIWHGWVAPISLVLGLFDRSIRIYEVNNTGWWYDLAYYLAVAGGFGGLSFVRQRRGRGRGNGG